jgi:TonB family protein
MAVPRFRVTERQVLLLLMAASLFTYGAIFLLSGFRRRLEGPPRTSQPPRVFWMPAGATASETQPAYFMARYFDPSLMTLPSAHGYSRALWQRRANDTRPTFDPPVELALLEPVAAGEMPVLLAQPPLPLAVQATAKKSPAAPEDIASPDEVVHAGTQSTVRVEGELASRELVQQPELPVVASGSALRRTRVRIAVTPDGRVQYVTLERSCGNESVDAQALELARQLRFVPSRSADPLALEWTTLRFNWATK